MAQSKADTPQTETDFWASVTRDDWLKAHGLDADTPQTERCGDCKHYKTANIYIYGDTKARVLDCPYADEWREEDDNACDRFEPKDEQTDCPWK